MEIYYSESKKAFVNSKTKEAVLPKPEDWLIRGAKDAEHLPDGLSWYQYGVSMVLVRECKK